ncbi:MAG: SAM-dependent methyltransferase [Gemmatimonadaceae bacterium]
MYSISPIGFVRSSRELPRDDFWGDENARIELVPDIPAESLLGLAEFSHAEILYLFHHDAADAAIAWSRHPRGNSDWPSVGIFAQRARRRPNRIGATIVRVVSVQGATIVVDQIDASDGTPVLDIKPVFGEFLPTGPMRQPTWTTELMADYWRTMR